MNNNADFEPDAFSTLLPQENVVWLVFLSIAYICQFVFVVRFMFTSKRILAHNVDRYASAMLIILNAGVLMRTIGLNIEDTMSLIYALSL